MSDVLRRLLWAAFAFGLGFVAPIIGFGGLATVTLYAMEQHPEAEVGSGMPLIWPAIGVSLAMAFWIIWLTGRGLWRSSAAAGVYGLCLVVAGALACWLSLFVLLQGASWA